MSDFDISDIEDEDQIEITDLDSGADGSGTSLSLALLEYARNIPFLANTRTKNSALALVICVFVLLVLVQPDLTSSQALGTGVSAQSSSLFVRSPMFIVAGSSLRQITWIKIANGVEIVRQAPPGIIVWRGCKLLNWHVPRKYQRPIIFICK